MKKPKIVALALIVSIMLVGAGYAAWNESLLVNSSLTMGNLNMEFSFADIKEGSDLVKVNKFVSDDKKFISFDITNMYPGSKYYVCALEKNTGSIPVSFDGIQIDIEKNSKKSLVSKFKVSCSGAVIDSNGNTIKNLPSFIDVPLNELEKKLNKIFRSTTLQPGQSITLGSDANNLNGCMRFKLDESAGNSTELSNLKFSILINWKQG